MSRLYLNPWIITGCSRLWVLSSFSTKSSTQCTRDLSQVYFSSCSTAKKPSNSISLRKNITLITNPARGQIKRRNKEKHPGASLTCSLYFIWLKTWLIVSWQQEAPWRIQHGQCLSQLKAYVKFSELNSENTSYFKPHTDIPPFFFLTYSSFHCCHLWAVSA